MGSQHEYHGSKDSGSTEITAHGFPYKYLPTYNVRNHGIPKSGKPSKVILLPAELGINKPGSFWVQVKLIRNW